MKEIISGSFSLLGVIVSAAIAYFISKRQTKIEIEKTKLEIDTNYRQKLYEQRLAIYPELSFILAELGSCIRSGKLRVEIVKDVWDKVRSWDARYSILMSALSMHKMITLRNQLIAISNLDDEYVSNNKARNKLMPAIIELQLALKTELGVMDADGFHNPSEIQHIRQALASIPNEKD